MARELDSGPVVQADGVALTPSAPAGASRVVAPSGSAPALRAVLPALQALLVFVIIIGVWAAISAGFNLSQAVLPRPWTVFQALSSNTALILRNAVPTVAVGVLGYLMAAVLGIPLGWALARPSRLQSMLTNGVLSAQIFPKIAVAPLLIVWFGFGYLPKILFVFLLVFFSIAINAATGFSSVPLELRELAQMLGLRPLARFTKIELPCALPNIFAGLKIAGSWTIVAAVVMEFVGSSSGLGYLILETETSLQVPLMFAVFVVITVFGYFLYGIVVLAEALLIPWHISRRQGRQIGTL